MVRLYLKSHNMGFCLSSNMFLPSRSKGCCLSPTNTHSSTLTHCFQCSLVQSLSIIATPEAGKCCSGDAPLGGRSLTTHCVYFRLCKSNSHAESFTQPHHYTFFGRCVCRPTGTDPQFLTCRFLIELFILLCCNYCSLKNIQLFSGGLCTVEAYSALN